jgi:hypothetical protein
MSAEVQQAADRLARVLDAAPRRLADISDADASRRSAPGRWAAKEIIGHLIDSASNNHQRFVRGQLFSAVDLPTYQQEQWVETQGYAAEPWADLVDLWLLLNRHLLHIMRNARESALATPMAIGGRDPVPLSDVMIDYVRHLEHHLGQVLGS